GNQVTVRHLREAIAAGRMPQAIILAGPRGAGKYTLAIMLAQTMACLQQPVTDGLPDFCGVCSNCTRIALSQPLEERMQEAIAAREELREVDKKDTRILIRTHPDVIVIPPDPPQLLIKLGQVRSVVQSIQRLPSQAPRALYIFTSSAFMKEAANSLLKVLEEPPPYAHIVLLAENVGDLLPTIRSRSGIFRLGALRAQEIEALLANERKDWNAKQRQLVARLADGAVGQALGFDLEGHLANRQDALVILSTVGPDPDYGALFRVTETYRAGSEGQQKTRTLLHAFASLVEDLLLIKAGTPHLMRNIDLTNELAQMSENIDIAWIEAAVRGLDQVEQGLRRNLLRSLSLDSFAAGLAHG
ncbi:MAG: DNA polymerase III subunit delta', partial [Acidobacteriaceae bacterium]